MASELLVRNVCEHWAPEKGTWKCPHCGHSAPASGVLPETCGNWCSYWRCEEGCTAYPCKAEDEAREVIEPPGPPTSEGVTG